MNNIYERGNLREAGFRPVITGSYRSLHPKVLRYQNRETGVKIVMNHVSNGQYELNYATTVDEQVFSPLTKLSTDLIDLGNIEELINFLENPKSNKETLKAVNKIKRRRIPLKVLESEVEAFYEHYH